VDPADIIDRLGLERHPEGGHYRRIFLDPEGRASSILYLPGAGERSRWHRIDGVEIWNHCGGGLLALSVSSDGGAVERLPLGSPPDGRPQAIVPAGTWQCGEPLADHALVTCMVIPAFRWDGFELAPDGWEPGLGGVGTGPGSR
jgi:predicted cupin superfamily sugar epimerase